MKIFRLRNKVDGRYHTSGMGNYNYTTKSKLLSSLKTGYSPWEPENWEIVEYDLVEVSTEDLT